MLPCYVQPENPTGTTALAGVSRGRADDQRHGGEEPRHLRARLAQGGGAVATLAVLGMDPDPHVHLAVVEFAEHHSDLLPGVDGHEPRRLFGLDAGQRRTDLVVDVAGGSAGSVAGGVHLLGASDEDVAILVGGEGPNLKALRGAC